MRWCYGQGRFGLAAAAAAKHSPKIVGFLSEMKEEGSGSCSNGNIAAYN